MKNYLILLTALSLAFGMTSCQKDDGIVNENLSENLVGLWKVGKIIYADCDDPSQNGTWEYVQIDCPPGMAGICYEVSYEFKSDNTLITTVTGVSSGVSNTLTGIDTYYYDGTTLQICTENGNACKGRSLEINGSTGILGKYAGVNIGNCDITTIIERE